MSRSGYNDYHDDQWALIRWRGAVAQAMRGKRGQAFFREALEVLDAMPEKRLIPHSFGEPGSYCTLGAVGASRGATMPALGDPDPYYCDDVSPEAAAALDIPRALAAEVMWMNDEGGAYYYRHDESESPEQRWARMRKWISEQIKNEPAANGGDGNGR